MKTDPASARFSPLHPPATSSLSAARTEGPGADPGSDPGPDSRLGGPHAPLLWERLLDLIRLYHYSVAWITLAIGLAVTLYSFRFNRDYVRQKADDRFQARIDQITSSLVRELHSHEQLLRAGQSLYAASDRVSREEWGQFVANFDIETHFPGILAMGYSQYLGPGDLENHQQKVRQEGFPHYRVWPEGKREAYSSIIYIEPFSAPNLSAFGFDMFSEPHRRKAMERARDSGRAAVTGRVVLVQDKTDNPQNGFLMYLPVYEKGKSLATVEDRRRHLRGWVYSPFRITEFVTANLGYALRDIALEIHLEGAEGAEGRQKEAEPFFLSGKRKDHRDSLALDLTGHRRIPIGGEVWSLTFRPRPLFEEGLGTGTPHYILVGGLSISLLLFGLTLTLAWGRGRTLRDHRQLQEKEENLQAALGASETGIYRWSLASGEVEADITLEKLLGKKVTTIMDILEAAHPEGRDGLDRELDRCRRQGGDMEWEFETRAPEGVGKWLLIRGRVQPGADGEPAYMVGTCTNISQRREAEEALQIQAQVLNNMGEGVALLDLEGRFIFANPTAEAIFRFAPGEMIGLVFWDLLRGDAAEREARRNEVVGRLQEREAFYGDLEQRRQDGGLLVSQVRITALKTRHRSYWVCVIDDVTEEREAVRQLKKSEAMLRQAQKMEAVGRLAGGIAHDFNNLLTAINGYSDLSITLMDPEDPLYSNLVEIKKAGERAASLTGQLLAFSRQQVLAPKLVNLSAIVADMDKMLRRLIGEDIEAVTDLAPQLEPIKVDPGQIQQVIVNLVINARDAMPEGGRLLVETGRFESRENDVSGLVGEMARLADEGLPPGRYSYLAVQDSGHGMDEATKARLFEPFFTTKEPGKGTGLGLSTVYGIVKQSGGHIQVFSAPGKGSTFRILFPSVSAEAGAEGPVKGRGEGFGTRGHETVLVVEDEAALLKLVNTVLTGHGYTVVQASSGEEALALVRNPERPIDLLLTDVVMARMNGKELAERIWAVKPDLRVLFMSGYTDDARLRSGVVDDPNSFLQKPFTAQDLLEKVRTALNRKISSR